MVKLLRKFLYIWDVVATYLDSLQLKYWWKLKDYCDFKELEDKDKYKEIEEYEKWEDVL